MILAFILRKSFRSKSEEALKICKIKLLIAYLHRLNFFLIISLKLFPLLLFEHDLRTDSSLLREITDNCKITRYIKHYVKENRNVSLIIPFP